MKKYLKRWKKLTEEQKFMFLNAYLHRNNMCKTCIGSSDYSGRYQPSNCLQCHIMFPPNEAIWWRFSEKCPCNQLRDGRTKDHPPTVIEYCLIHDGWIEKE